MGDINSSDCSWKKIVIAKTNNEWVSAVKQENVIAMTNSEWVSTIKQENFDTEDSVNTSITSSDSEHVENFSAFKSEDDCLTQVSNMECMIQNCDPLLIESGPQRRRRGSGGLKSETPAERKNRLAKMSAYAAKKLAKETPEQRAIRLKRMSEYSARKLAQETIEQRAARLAKMSAYAARRLAQETPEQRQIRLARMQAYSAKRNKLLKAQQNNLLAPFQKVNTDNSSVNDSNQC